MQEIGLLGFGSFGKFITTHLREHFKIEVYNRSKREKEIEEYGAVPVSIERAASRKFVILAVPVQFLEDTLIRIKNLVQPNAIVIDVSSVKMKPYELMKQHLPKSIEIVCTHPLFGPQSGKNGIEGLNMVLCPCDNIGLYKRFYRFFADTMKLRVLERTAELHDKQMAYVQALTHFVGRAINEMDIPDVEQKTPAYQYLLNIKRNLGNDSMDLFLTIEQENPFAKEIRESFIHELNVLNDWLNKTEDNAG